MCVQTRDLLVWTQRSAPHRRQHYRAPTLSPGSPVDSASWQPSRVRLADEAMAKALEATPSEPISEPPSRSRWYPRFQMRVGAGACVHTR